MPSKVIANRGETPQRADVLLANAYPQYSRAALVKLFDMNLVTQDSEPIRPGDKIKPNGTFGADISPLKKQAEKIDLPIIYEDENVIVIDKPKGVISHARGKFWDEPSVASFVRDKVSGLEGERAGIVHRLDRATSGIMICAKNPKTMSFLQKQFANRKTKKTYIAIVRGDIDPQEALIDVPIARDPKKPRTFHPDPDGKNATTKYRVLKSNDKYSLLELIPQTGRTHQLRVHLKYINHPIVGDTLYGGEPSGRLYLHAFTLEITLPGGERKVFTSNLPENFKAHIK